MTIYSLMHNSYSIKVLGCKVNQSEAMSFHHLLHSFGYHKADRNESASMIIVHTCAVTAKAASKSMQAVRSLRRKHPEALLVVTGCALAAPDFHRESLPRCCYIPAGPDLVSSFEQVVEQHAGEQHILRPACRAPLKNERTRVFLKIQDGCNIRCTYCIVPDLRGDPRDKPLSDILSEARDIIASGCPEVVIAGISVGLYGGGGPVDLAQVIHQLLRLPGMRRLRLSSLHPQEISEALLAACCDARVMPHFHLSLQSGSNPILEKMKRGYMAEDYLRAVAMIRQIIPEPALTTDVIVGFPGETEACFEETMAFCRKVGFSKIHAFPYSSRPGTPAASMPDQVSQEDKQARMYRFQEMADDLRRRYMAHFIGRDVEMLVEQYLPSTGCCHGHTNHYLPITFSGDKRCMSRVCRVHVDGANHDGLTGTMRG